MAKVFLTFAFLQALSFVVQVVNIRALAHLKYKWAVLTDGLICLLGWTILRYMIKNDSIPALAGYLTGGMIGSFLGMWISRAWGSKDESPK